MSVSRRRRPVSFQAVFIGSQSLQNSCHAWIVSFCHIYSRVCQTVFMHGCICHCDTNKNIIVRLIVCRKFKMWWLGSGQVCRRSIRHYLYPVDSFLPIPILPPRLVNFATSFLSSSAPGKRCKLHWTLERSHVCKWFYTLNTLIQGTWKHMLLCIFTARCYAYRGLCRHKMSVRLSVCLSVRPSVTRRYSVELARYILILFLPVANHAILVFRTKRYGNIPTGTLNGGVECKGCEKFAIFD